MCDTEFCGCSSTRLENWIRLRCLSNSLWGWSPIGLFPSSSTRLVCVCVFAPSLPSAAALQELLLHAAARLLLCVGAWNQSSQKKTVPGTQGPGLSAVHVLPVPWAVGWPLAGWIQGPCTAASTGLALRFAVLYVDVVVGARPSPGVACGEPLSLAANWVWLELLGVSDRYGRCAHQF